MRSSIKYSEYHTNAEIIGIDFEEVWGSASENQTCGGVRMFLGRRRSFLTFKKGDSHLALLCVKSKTNGFSDPKWYEIIINDISVGYYKESKLSFYLSLMVEDNAIEIIAKNEENYNYFLHLFVYCVYSNERKTENEKDLELGRWIRDCKIS